MAGSLPQVRRELVERLRGRSSEIEQAVLTRVYAITDPGQTLDPIYAEGVRGAVSAGLDYGLAAIERGEFRAAPLPDVLLAQARAAARSGTGLDTVMRRYFAGYALLGDFLIDEADKARFASGSAMTCVMRIQAAVFDHIVAAVSEEYARAAPGRTGSTDQRRAEQITRLLAGELMDAQGLDYEFSAHHIALVAAGPGALDELPRLCRAAEGIPLLVRRDDATAWAWLGSQVRLDPVALMHLIDPSEEPGVTVAIGEPGHGIAGWRLSHHQAAAALPIALERGVNIVRYGDVALLATALRNDLLAAALRDLYLEPLSTDRDGGEAIRETLWAYFEADHSVSSAAAKLGVNRNTVSSRLRAAEEKLGRTIASCTAELIVGLRLEGLNEASRSPDRHLPVPSAYGSLAGNMAEKWQLASQAVRT